MSFPRYPEYKDSGVQWLGEVPEHWIVMPLKRDIEFITSGARGWAENYADDGDLFLRIGNLTRDSIRLDLSDTQRVVVPYGAEVDRTQVQAGDILFSITAYLGSVAVVPAVLGRAFVSQHVALVRPSKKHCISEWLAYVAISYVGKTHLETTGYGGTKVQLSLADVTSLPMIVPPIDEQQAITTFLDRETAKIDALVAEQEKLIALLQEKRQAVISHAVTKGLNPNVPMKDSGVEWLGEVPAHWEVRRVKDYFQTCSGGTPNTGQQALYYTDEENGIPWVRTTDLQNDILRNVEVFITEQALIDTACSILPKGTVMVAMYGGDGTVGKNGLLAIAAAINQAVCGLLPANTHSPEYTFRFMQFYRPHWMIGAESSRKDPNISQERVRNAPFLRPPIEEQKDIVTFLDHQLCAFDTLMAEARTAITLLQERRTALISAAVTGQIDVRNWSPQEGA